MSDQPNQPDLDPQKGQQPLEPPDGRGPRPTDPNELARWIAEQTTNASEDDSADPPAASPTSG